MIKLHQKEDCYSRLMVHYTKIENSSLISEVYYDDLCKELTVVFKKYYVPFYIYENVSLVIFKGFSEVKSVGKFYLNMVKDKFTIKNKTMTKTKTAAPVAKDRPKTVNNSSDEKRFIKLNIDVTKINKDWLVVGEKGTYLNITLAMLPDGELDGYGNLGMITQDVPKSIFENERTVPSDKKTRGSILGNAAEFQRRNFDEAGQPGSNAGKTMGNIPKKDADDADDDLPF